jgi:hypothetical protein
MVLEAPSSSIVRDFWIPYVSGDGQVWFFLSLALSFR